MNDFVDSDDVIGTNVYGPDGDHIGSVEKLVFEKSKGQIAYAVISFGGFLGMGENYYPIPWGKLRYDPNLEGFQIDITEEQLKQAPSYERGMAYDWSDENSRKVYGYYGSQPWW